MTRNDCANWCLAKAEEALKDFDQPTAVNYVRMARMWLYHSI